MEIPRLKRRGICDLFLKLLAIRVNAREKPIALPLRYRPAGYKAQAQASLAVNTATDRTCSLPSQHVRRAGSTYCSALTRYWAGTHPTVPSGSRTLFQIVCPKDRGGPTSTISVPSGQAFTLSSKSGVLRMKTPSPSVFPTTYVVTVTAAGAVVVVVVVVVGGGGGGGVEVGRSAGRVGVASIIIGAKVAGGGVSSLQASATGKSKINNRNARFITNRPPLISGCSCYAPLLRLFQV